MIDTGSLLFGIAGFAAALYWRALYKRGIRSDLENFIAETFEKSRSLRLSGISETGQAPMNSLYRLEIGGTPVLDAGPVLGKWSLFYTPELRCSHGGPGAVIAQSEGAFGLKVELQILDSMTWRSDLLREVLERCHIQARALR